MTDVTHVGKCVQDNRPSSSIEGTVFPNKVLGELRLAPEDARNLKPVLKSAFVVTPKDPFLVTGHDMVGSSVSADHRGHVYETSILFADIQCALLMDGDNKVLQAYPTR
jgi:hypothetical protein